uniref:DUF4378 domain-containing protein n=2 Tax=Kalanchoe fedtschenkoi TaxID=63787 RepID=A0A7N0UUH7_KALFE
MLVLSYTAAGVWYHDNHYPFDGSMKKLVSEEVSESNTRHNTPGIVARLMGMGTLPSDTNLVFQPAMKKNGNLEFSLPKKEGAKQGTFRHVSISSKSTRQLHSNLLHNSYGQNDPDDSDQWLEKQTRREHPQEEELQKFKIEFEAWQAARLRECSQQVEIGNAPEYMMSQADFDREKVIVYANSNVTGGERLVELDTSHPAQSHLGNGLLQEKYNRGIAGAKFKGNYNPMSNNWSTRHGSKEVSLIISDCKMDNSSAPTRIVILQPGPDLAANDDDSRASSSSTVEDKSSIVDFLEEVKERLKTELQGRPLKRNPAVRGGGIETPFSEKLSYPKTNGIHTSKNTRDTEIISRDFELMLRRSESTRSYRSESQFHGPSSPEYVSSDTRRFLTERVRNVLKKDTRHDPAVGIRGSSICSEFHSEGGRFDLCGGALWNEQRPNVFGKASDLKDMRARNQSVRYGLDNDFMINKEQSPGNLIRSLSAPVSATSFAKLLLEDRHIVTGVQIRRKHEHVNNAAESLQRQRKERFNFREKFSSFRHNFTLRKKLFGKKLQSMKESSDTRHDFLNDNTSVPSVMMNFVDRYENSTEVPPSPASVCSSINEEFWRPSRYSSPVSTPDVRSLDGDSIPHVFREISSNLSDLRRELKQLASNERDYQSVSEDLVTEDIVDIMDPVEAYIRDLLVASGLYNGSADKHFISSDPKPINNGVFQEVEGKLGSDQEFDKGLDEKKVDHKAVLDLLNEILPSILMPSSSVSELGRELTGYHTLPIPLGNKLLKIVWEIIHPYVQPPTDKSYYSLDNMVSKDLQAIPWAQSMYKEASFVGKELECLIMGDILEEIVKDIYCV